MLTARERSAYVDPFARDWPGLATTDTGISCFCFKKFTLLNYLQYASVTLIRISSGVISHL